MVRVLCRWAKFVGFGCLQDLGAPLREPMCVSRRPVKEELFILQVGLTVLGSFLGVFVQLMLGLALVFQAG